jgi:hypothetical protein
MDYCAICGCKLTRGGKEYGKQTKEGRSHATGHHYVAKRFLSRSDRNGVPHEPIFKNCPWGMEGQSKEFCYECHEELLHNPVLLPTDINGFKKLVERRNLNETRKTASKDKIAGRIELFHEVIEKGIKALLVAEKQR